MATIQDIANHANVSKATVSRVLNKSTVVNENTRNAVVRAMDALNYQPNLVARSLAGGRSMTIGVMTQQIGSPFYDTVSRGVIEGLSDTDYSPIFVDGVWEQSTESELIRTLLGRRVDGLVIIGGDLPIDELEQLRRKLPTVVVAREVDRDGWQQQNIFADNVLAGKIATKHLIEFGHQHIAIVRGIEHQPDAIDRYEGYLQALDEADIEFDPKLVYQGDFTGQSGVMAVNAFLTRGSHFSAILAANDMVAFGARLGLHRHGIRVPEDVSIVGFDDQSEAAYMTPPLTTMRQPALEMGTEAASTVLGLIHGDTYNLPEFPIELQRRESVARLR
ncbi:UNVERIFIED_CONTAM: hypothetical protein GTU68_032160 [Idotea baltica]|nr:hypothetical protein [Idotea baltica]